MAKGNLVEKRSSFEGIQMKSSATLEINRPIEDVFAFVADARNMDQWVVGVSDVRLVSDRTDTVGARYESDYTYSGRTQRMTYEVTEYDAPNRYAIRGEGPFPFAGELVLEETATGTRVTNTIDAGSDGLFTTAMFTLFAPLMRRVMARRLKEELVALQSAMESSSTPQTAV